MSFRKWPIVTSILASAVAVSGCGGGSGGTTETVTVAPPAPVVLASTNGDVGKYLGVWSSGCAMQRNDGVSGGNSIFEGVINTLDLTSVSGSTVRGTLTSVVYPSSILCTGPVGPVPLISNISINYVVDVPAAGQSGQTPVFSGSADQVAFDTAGASGSTLILGFNSNYRTFELSAKGYFSSTDVIYTKQ